MILLDTGLRIGELVNLKMDDVHMDEGYLKVMGKGKKERCLLVIMLKGRYSATCSDSGLNRIILLLVMYSYLLVANH